MLRSLILALALVGIAGAALAGPEGTWLTEGGKSHVEIRLCGEEFCGRIVWLREPHNEDGSVKLDTNNKDETLRSRGILGLELLSGFAAGGEGPWKGGPDLQSRKRQDLPLEPPAEERGHIGG